MFAKKNILRSMLALATSMCLLVGCGQGDTSSSTAPVEVKPITGAQFKEIAEGLNYYVYDQSELTQRDNELVSESYVAFSLYDQNLTFEFDVYKEEQGAIDLYDYLVASMESGKSAFENCTLTQTDQKYQLDVPDEGYFYYVFRAEKSIYIAFTTYAYREDVLALAQAMGYN